MESKLLVGGKNIIDHTNEQQKMLEMKRQEIAEQVELSVPPRVNGSASECACRSDVFCG